MTIRKTQSPAFTLIELLVVIGIIIIMAGVMIPAINAITKGNSQKQAVNTITAYLSAARTRAIAEGRQVGVVFFEDINDPTRTGMQICVESLTRRSNTGVEYTAFNAVDSRIEYLPRGVSIATLGDDAARFASVADNTASLRFLTRAIIFDSQGQLSLRNGLCIDDFVTAGHDYRVGDVVATGAITAGAFPVFSLDSSDPRRLYLCIRAGTSPTLPTPPAKSNNNWVQVQWQFNVPFNVLEGAAPNNLQDASVSSPGLFVFNRSEFDAATNGGTDAQRSTWIKDHAEVVIVNANTGAVIR